MGVLVSESKQHKSIIIKKMSGWKNRTVCTSSNVMKKLLENDIFTTCNIALRCSLLPMICSLLFQCY